jgi:hypothetical protein
MGDAYRALACGLWLAVFSALSFGQAQQKTIPPSSKLAPPIHLSSEQDHQRTMELLHITSLRQGPDGDPKSPNADNFDEAKVSPYSLPDPLRLKNGKKVETVEAWWKLRRPEIVEDFDREIYGRVPKNVPKVHWEVKSTTKEMNGDFPVITKELIGHVDNSAYPFIHVDINLTLSTPAHATTRGRSSWKSRSARRCVQRLPSDFLNHQLPDRRGSSNCWRRVGDMPAL